MISKASDVCSDTAPMRTSRKGGVIGRAVVGAAVTG